MLFKPRKSRQKFRGNQRGSLSHIIERLLHDHDLDGRLYESGQRYPPDSDFSATTGQNLKKAMGMRVLPVRKVCKMGSQ